MENSFWKDASEAGLWGQHFAGSYLPGLSCPLLISGPSDAVLVPVSKTPTIGHVVTVSFPSCGHGFARAVPETLRPTAQICKAGRRLQSQPISELKDTDLVHWKQG